MTQNTRFIDTFRLLLEKTVSLLNRMLENSKRKTVFVRTKWKVTEAVTVRPGHHSPNVHITQTQKQRRRIASLVAFLQLACSKC